MLSSVMLLITPSIDLPYLLNCAHVPSSRTVKGDLPYLSNSAPFYHIPRGGNGPAIPV
ncbi:hypothetical protein BDZ91DRAFT_735924, partial [Kalaharituber pfeilii]